MPTEATISAQEQLAELKADTILHIIEFVLAHPIITVLIVVGTLLILSWLIILLFSAIRKYMRKNEISELGPIPAAALRNEPDKKEVTLDAPSPYSNHDFTKLPDILEDLAVEIENASPGERFRYCVFGDEKNRIEKLSWLFYHRIKAISNSAEFDHYGWIIYKKDKDDPDLSINSCFFRDLRFCQHHNDRKERLYHQLEFFRNDQKHTILMIHMRKPPEKNDDLLNQINSMDGLSVILFSEKQVNNFESINLNQRGA